VREILAWQDGTEIQGTAGVAVLGEAVIHGRQRAVLDQVKIDPARRTLIATQAVGMALQDLLETDRRRLFVMVNAPLTGLTRLR
jgi:hypothetical protein